MVKKAQGTRLRNNKLTGKYWLETCNGRRISMKFKLYSKKDIDGFIVLSTSIGKIVYHEKQEELICHKGTAYSVSVNKVNDNIYSVESGVGWEKLLCDTQGNRVLEEAIHEFLVMGNNLIAVCLYSTLNWGVLDVTNSRKPKWAIEPSIIWLNKNDETDYVVMDFSKNKGIFVFDKELKTVLGPLRYKYVDFLTSDLLAVQDDGCWGVINLKGDIIVPVKYKSVLMSGEFFIVRQNKYGLLDKEGKCLLECTHDKIIEKDDKFVVRDFTTSEIFIAKKVSK